MVRTIVVDQLIALIIQTPYIQSATFKLTMNVLPPLPKSIKVLDPSQFTLKAIYNIVAPGNDEREAEYAAVQLRDKEYRTMMTTQELIIRNATHKLKRIRSLDWSNRRRMFALAKQKNETDVPLREKELVVRMRAQLLQLAVASSPQVSSFIMYGLILKIDKYLERSS